jgi:hypothetical protein
MEHLTALYPWQPLHHVKSVSFWATKIALVLERFQHQREN